jgi:hypothetical protein
MFGIPEKRRRWLFMLSLITAAGAIGCGGSVRETLLSNNGTTAGTYMYTITATDSANSSLTAKTTITVTVQ